MREPGVKSRVHHLALGSHDVERLARFYREVIGLDELTRHVDQQGQLRSIWLDLGAGIRLMIEATAAPARRVEGVGSGLFLLALRVTAEERRHMELMLEAAGQSIESRTEFSSYARDPDDNRIAISHYPDPALAREP